jgi:hypothetical protein
MVVSTATSSGHEFAVPRPGDVLDLRHAPTRLAVLLNIAAAGTQLGHDWARPWMLQVPWAGEEENLAARCVVAALQAIERDKTPPIGVLGTWPKAYFAPNKRWYQFPRPPVMGATRRSPRPLGVSANRGVEPATVLAERRVRDDEAAQAAGFLLVGVDL